MTYDAGISIVFYTGFLVTIGITAWRIGLALYHLAHGRYFVASDSYMVDILDGVWSRVGRLIT